MGELRQRGRIWWIRYYRNGRRYEESSGSDKKGKAIELLKLREGDGARGLPISPKVGRLRFDDAVAAVVTDYRTNKKRSVDSLEMRIEQHLKPAFSGQRMTAIGTAVLRDYIARRQAPIKHDDGTETPGAKNATINRELAVVKRAFKLALKDGHLFAMPHIPMLRENNARQGFFEPSQVEDVLARLPRSVRPVITFAYLTGWRIRSEVLPLTWAQVDLKAGIVRLEPGTTKSGEGRTFPFGAIPSLKGLLEEQRALTDALQKRLGRIVPHVFHRQGEPIRSFYKAWRKACRGAGCPGRIPHDFRRTAVRNLVRSGVPEKTAMIMTGHKTRAVFDRYDIVNEADLREAARKLAVSLTGTKQGQLTASGT